MVVLDSSFLIAFHNRNDVHHTAAAEAMEQILAGRWGQALLLEYVFLEVITVLLVRRGHEPASRVGGLLLDAPEIDFIPCSDFFVDTFEAFRTEPGGRLSFADAAIVTATRRLGADGVVTFDRDFAGLEGVRVLPSP